MRRLLSVLFTGTRPEPELFLQELLRPSFERRLRIAGIDVLAALLLHADVDLEVARVDEAIEVLGALLAGTFFGRQTTGGAHAGGTVFARAGHDRLH